MDAIMNDDTGLTSSNSIEQKQLELQQQQRDSHEALLQEQLLLRRSILLGDGDSNSGLYGSTGGLYGAGVGGGGASLGLLGQQPSLPGYAAAGELNAFAGGGLGGAGMLGPGGLGGFGGGGSSMFGGDSTLEGLPWSVYNNNFGGSSSFGGGISGGGGYSGLDGSSSSATGSSSGGSLQQSQLLMLRAAAAQSQQRQQLLQQQLLAHQQRQQQEQELFLLSQMQERNALLRSLGVTGGAAGGCGGGPVLGSNSGLLSANVGLLDCVSASTAPVAGATSSRPADFLTGTDQSSSAASATACTTGQHDCNMSNMDISTAASSTIGTHRSKANNTHSKRKPAAAAAAATAPKVKGRPPTKFKKPRDEDRPKRPLSAYNIFFKEQRSKMLLERAQEDAAAAAADAATGGAEGTFKKKPGIPFGYMAKHIASMWKAIDEKSLDEYHYQAQREKSRYSSEMEVYNQKKGKDLELNRRQLEATVDESIKKRYFESSAVDQAAAVRSGSKQSASKK